MNKPAKIAGTQTVENVLQEMDAGRPHVYQAIAEVQGELAKTGIAKTRTNTQGSGYQFRGIDDVYAALSPLLAKHKLVVVPRVTQREVIERQSRNGGALFYVTVHAEFDFVSAIDGTCHTAATFGEAMDSGDKATNKAMSAAYKYAAFMTFAIPTEGDNDADAMTHEVAPRAGETRTISNVRDDPFPLGPAKNKTQLKDMGRAFWRDVEACGDSTELECLLADKNNVALVAQLMKALPQWWDGGTDPKGETFEGLEAVIARKRRDFEQLETA